MQCTIKRRMRSQKLIFMALNTHCAVSFERTNLLCSIQFKKCHEGNILDEMTLWGCHGLIYKKNAILNVLGSSCASMLLAVVSTC